MEAVTVSDQLFFLTVRIETEKHVGTAFFYTADVGGEQETFIVTNRHLVEDAKSVKLIFRRSLNGSPTLGQTHVGSINAAAWHQHPTYDVDVAIFPLRAIVETALAAEWRLYLKAVGPEIRPSTEQLADLDSLEEVIFIGYPNGLYDRANYLPVIRGGITATPIHVPFDGRPAFLVDGSVFPGSSGSPVFIFNRGYFSSRSGPAKIGERVLFLGVLSEFKYREAGGWVEYKDAPVPHAKVGFQESIDLGVVYRDSAIRETIDDFLRKAGKLP